MELLLAQFLHNFAPWMVWGIAYTLFLITLGEVLTLAKVFAYLVLSALTGYIVFLFISLFSGKIIVFLWVSSSKETELLKAISWMGGFLWKYLIEWLIRFTPKYINKYAEKWIKQ